MIEQDKTQQLIELAKLRESGVVTEAEFLSLKKEIIDRKSPSNARKILSDSWNSVWQ
jgi:hypothetical protein